MFATSILETIYIISTIMSATMVFICLTEIFNNMDSSLIKLKEEREIVEDKIKAIEELGNDKEKIVTKKIVTEEVIKPSNCGCTSPVEINKLLVDENRRLHIRCDLLEEELHIMREANLINETYAFRIFN